MYLSFFFLFFFFFLFWSRLFNSSGVRPDQISMTWEVDKNVRSSKVDSCLGLGYRNLGIHSRTDFRTYKRGKGVEICSEPMESLLVYYSQDEKTDVT